MNARRRNLRWVAAFAVACALAVHAGAASACDCGPVPSIEEAFRGAAVVAEVEMVSAPEPRNKPGRTIRLKVLRAWKGATPGEELSIHRDADSSCSHHLDDARPQLLYLKRAARGVEVQECGRSGPAALSAEEIAALGKLATPLTGPSGAGPSAAAPSSSVPAAPGSSVPAAPSAGAPAAPGSGPATAPSSGAPAAGARGCGACTTSGAGAPAWAWWQLLGGAALGALLARRLRRRNSRSEAGHRAA